VSPLAIGSEHEQTFALVPRRRVAGAVAGTLRSLRRGSGTDVTGFRPYRTGDDVRRIDHRVSARLVSASGADEFVLRQDLTEETGRVVVVVDRRPTMALYPDRLPWLSKPRAVEAAGRLIAASARETRCLVGYLDDADAGHARPEKRRESPFWRPPDGRLDLHRMRERYLPYEVCSAPPDTLERLFAFLGTVERSLPPGTFVFVVSDFLVEPGERAWADLVARGWDVVPVVVQDPRWERSFPDVAGSVVPVVDPAGGQCRLVRPRRSEVDRRRAEHERRFERLLTRFELLGLDCVVLSDHRLEHVLEAFADWAAVRRLGARIAR
jgi:uncharacterized protein (DUF58 family)